MSNEPIDVRAYAETRGISTEEAARELGEQYESEPAPSPGFGHNSGATLTAPDVRAYAETRGISTAQAAAELGEQYESEPAGQQFAGMNAGGFGHNSGATLTAPDVSTLTMAARDKLKQIAARVNKLDEEKKEVANQIKDVYAEAKAMGYDTKALRVVIRELNMDRQEREERDAILDVYREALGMAD